MVSQASQLVLHGYCPVESMRALLNLNLKEFLNFFGGWGVSRNGEGKWKSCSMAITRFASRQLVLSWCGVQPVFHAPNRWDSFYWASTH